MKISVLTFGHITDIVNSCSFEVPNVSDTDSLQQLLEEKYPQLKEVKYAIAVDKKITSGNVVFRDNSVVALLPPFSGG